MTRTVSLPQCRSPQRGISLITTLLFTVAALLLGVSVMGINVMQERMVGNSRDRDLAFQAAEAALRDAEFDIQNNIGTTAVFADNCANGLCTTPSRRLLPSALPVEKQAGFDWANGGMTRTYGEFTGAGTFPNVQVQPVYVIEQLGLMALPSGESIPDNTDAPRRAYRITAHAIGARAETVVQLQSIYYRP